MTEGVGGFGQLLQRPAFPPGKGGDRQHGDQHHKQRRGEENIGDLVHDLGDFIGRGGHQHDALGIAVHQNRAGHHVAAVGVQAVDDAGGGIAAVPDNLLQVGLIQLQALMLTAGGSVGAKHHVPLAVADHRVSPGHLGCHGQVQLKRPVGQPAAVKVGGGQLRYGIRVLLQPGEGGVREEPVDLYLKGRAQNGHGHQQDRRGGEKAAAEATFHAYSTSNLYPTPQTVFRLHWSLTPSSFSRRRFTWTSTVRESPK